MKRHILIINGNPDPSAERLSGGLAHAYAEGAEENGHLVRRLNIGALRFPLLQNGADFLTSPTDEAIITARGQILLADHLIFIYPLWLGGPPALLKGFMEQVARHEFALGASAKGFPIGKLKGRSARVIVTMGMPALAYRIWYGAHGVKSFNRSILGISGISPVTTTYMGGVGNTNRTKRMVEQTREMGRRAH